MDSRFYKWRFFADTIPQDTCFIHNRFVVDLNKNLTKNNFKSLVNKRVFCLEINLDGLDRFVGVLLRNHFQNGCIVKLYRQIDCINGQKRAFTHNYTYIFTDFKKIAATSFFNIILC